MSKYSRSNATFKNYAVSLGIIVAIVLAMAFVVATRSGEHIPSVDYRPDLRVVEEAADYPVAAPSPQLEEQGWTPTSTTVAVDGPVEWSVGFATAEDSHVMFTQSDGDPDDVVAERARGAEPAGNVSVGTREWEHLTSADWSALVLREEDRTLVVAGPADLDELAHFANGLELTGESAES
ncbi:DUF4245 domain-containing protein [Nocardiopsis algeriensis]|uniref:Putative iron-regulated membrane protein n=1 Tax=Nocardiopsis algeriensis TaxID=1478215 RepID=A0A841IVK2_9ACTN|nr:DUF4245 domain-containing protein [Nocardiopsis algeriensis]MBB6120231.1 putative iron-regulated membrane protein [Nocardiopsis algeriensis]